MNNNVFSLIKKKCPQDAETVNKLLVSAFVIEKNIKLSKNSFLEKYLLHEEDKGLIELIRILKTQDCKIS